jgi:hypothetical protein
MNSAAVLEVGDIDVSINFWITQRAFDQGLYDVVYHYVEQWLKEWPFENPQITNPMKPRE